MIFILSPQEPTEDPSDWDKWEEVQDEELSEMVKRAERDLQNRNSIGQRSSTPKANRRPTGSWMEEEDDDEDDEDDLRPPALRRDLQAQLEGMLGMC